MDENEITEIKKLTAGIVSAVGTPANGTPWLLVKAAENQDEDEGENDSELLPSEIADVMKGELATDLFCAMFDLTKAGNATAADFDEAQRALDTLPQDIVAKAKLKSKERNQLPDSAFAYISASGVRKLPVEDASHTRNALARFNQTEFDSSAAKTKARRKILAAAKRFGIDVGKNDNVTKSPGVPNDSTFVPDVKQLDHEWRTSSSDLIKPMTAGTDGEPDPTDYHGGESLYRIPADGLVQTNPQAPPQMNRVKGKKGKAKKYVSISKSKKDKGKELNDERNWMASENANAAKAAKDGSPGSSEWQKFDSQTLDGVAKALSHALKVVTEMRKRETTEAMTVDEDEVEDVKDLIDARSAMSHALRLVAALVYRENEGVKKETLDINSRTQMLAAFSAVANRVAAEAREQGPFKAKTSKGGTIMTEMTSKELAKLVAKTSGKEVKAAVKKERERNAKLLKAALKKKKNKGWKPANNGGDISADTILSEENGKYDANDVRAPGGTHAEGKYLNGKDKKAIKNAERSHKAALAQLRKEMARTNELVAKMASRPVPGGPVLDGQARGVGISPAASGRMSGGNQVSSEISTLEAQLQKAADSKDSVQVDHISQQLTLARLKAMHQAGTA